MGLAGCRLLRLGPPKQGAGNWPQDLGMGCGLGFDCFFSGILGEAPEPSWEVGTQEEGSFWSLVVAS